MSLRSFNDRNRNRSKQEKRSVGESSRRRPASKPHFYYKLAPETPVSPLIDESSYDSFHNYETDVCKDSSDGENSDANSSHTEGFAVMDVIEYDVADETESEDVSTASSGTDDFAIAAATEAYSHFSALLNGQCTDDEDDEFILADTEEDSDDSIDLELSHADFWKCVKCNNKQNNPLYRYCERCYQVRKSLFPPRPTPRHQRSQRLRSNLKRKITCLDQDYSTSEVDSDSDEQTSLSKKINLSPNAIPKNSGNSAGEGSSNNNDTSESENDEKTINSLEEKCKLNRVCKIQINPSSSIEVSKVKVTGTKLKPLSRNSYVEYKIENKIIQNVYEQDLPCSRNMLKTQDSGLSSCQESSQEVLSPKTLVTRSCSPGSTKSFESQSDFLASQESIDVQIDSALDNLSNDQILFRAEKFTLERKSCAEQIDKPLRPSDTLDHDTNDTVLGTCRFCNILPKNGVFEHSTSLHLCCCYPCALFLYKKGRNCPICNCKIKNVKKLFAH